MLPSKIVVIGAGSASFGLNTVGSLMRSAKLRGSQIALVDRNAKTLDLMRLLAERMNREWDAGMTITAHTHHDDALEGAGFVVSAIEVPPREVLWRQDYELTLKYGVRQPYAENGGPGGFAHAIRNILPVLEIAHAMEQACPDAWFLNFSNPMVRICDAIARYSKIKVVGLCHQIFAGYGMVGYVLADELGIDVPPGPISCHADPDIWPQLNNIAFQAVKKVHIQAAGLNHFTWMLGLRDRRNGQDLYGLFRERWAAFDPTFEPLTRRVFDAFGLFPIPGDEHLCEYLPWLSDPVTKPWEKYEVSLYDWERNDQLRSDGHRQIAAMGAGASADRCAARGRQRGGRGTDRGHGGQRAALSPGRQRAQRGADRQPAHGRHRRDAGDRGRARRARRGGRQPARGHSGVVPARDQRGAAVRRRGGHGRPAACAAMPVDGPGHHRPGRGQADLGRLSCDVSRVFAAVLAVG